MANAKLVFKGSHVLRIVEGTAHLFGLLADELEPRGSLSMPQTPSMVDVCASRPWVCWRDANHEVCWSWQAGKAPQQVAMRQGTRDLAAVGFIDADAEPLLAVGQGSELRLLDAEHVIRNTVELRRPHAWGCHRFAALPHGYVAITGRLFSDPQDMVITVALQDLLTDPQCVQHAIEQGELVHDRAERLVIGRAPNACALVIRDPGDEEPLDDKDDESPDVWGLRGYYVRSLIDSRLVSHGEYRGKFEKHAAVVATDSVIAVEVPGGIDIIHRHDGSIRTIRGEEVALDPANARVGSMASSGKWRVSPL